MLCRSAPRRPVGNGGRKWCLAPFPRPPGRVERAPSTKRVTVGNGAWHLFPGVGLSDIVPLRPFARSLVMLEMFCGVMYVAIVVSRLVALASQRVRDAR